MQQALIAPGTRILNAYDKETFVFTHPYEGGTTTRFDVILGRGGSGGGNAIAHIHPQSDETFTVHEGRLIVVIEGVEHVVNAGESATVPAGKRHYFRNGYDGDSRATVAFSNAQQHQRFFLNLAEWTANCPGYFSRNGAVKLLAIALCLNAYRDHLYIAGPPIALQKVMFALLAPVASLAGYRLAFRPRRATPKSAMQIRELDLDVERI